MPSSAERRGAWAWTFLGLVMALPAVAVGTGRTLAWDVLCWRPERVWDEPWRWWTAAWVHLSPLHLQANLMGLALVVALGWVAQADRRAVLAWALAWPLTHLLLLVQPELLRYGGLSGVLHAGVVIGAVCAWRGATRATVRGVALAIGVGAVAKVLSERPWVQTLSHPAGWDIPVAPGAHASGVIAGLVLALVLSWRPTEETPRR